VRSSFFVRSHSAARTLGNQGVRRGSEQREPPDPLGKRGWIPHLGLSTGFTTCSSASPWQASVSRRRPPRPPTTAYPPAARRVARHRSRPRRRTGRARRPARRSHLGELLRSGRSFRPARNRCEAGDHAQHRAGHGDQRRKRAVVPPPVFSTGERMNTNLTATVNLDLEDVSWVVILQVLHTYRKLVDVYGAGDDRNTSGRSAEGETLPVHHQIPGRPPCVGPRTS
jgi:hypothetical protein